MSWRRARPGNIQVHQSQPGVPSPRSGPGRRSRPVSMTSIPSQPAKRLLYRSESAGGRPGPLCRWRPFIITSVKTQSREVFVSALRGLLHYYWYIPLLRSSCLESLPIFQSDLVGDHAWAGTAAPRRLRAGVRTAGPGRRYHRCPGVIRVNAPILRRVHSHAHESRSATETE